MIRQTDDGSRFYMKKDIFRKKTISPSAYPWYDELIF